ncbi:hypothetical protein HPB52_005197 [Rhipicephalus sanguineus]|uniref:Peptidase M13 N-terminal domain-containing protein n=1 Tax=Rhipicephalus sanguineus TaxID=34632 RepID=A0A9D4PZI6_RHISA|nr:hypothetical protein HPB52_005197 [Rhipicephalus sanguineus]
MNENRSTSEPCSFSDSGEPLSATSSKWNPSSTEATSCKRGRRTPLKVRMAAAPSLYVSEVSYNDAVRSSDLLQPTECSSSSLATETTDTEYSYDQCSAYIAQVSEAEGTLSAYQQRVKMYAMQQPQQHQQQQLKQQQLKQQQGHQHQQQLAGVQPTYFDEVPEQEFPPYPYAPLVGADAQSLFGHAEPNDASRLRLAPSTSAATPRPSSAVNQPSCASDLFSYSGARSRDTREWSHSERQAPAEAVARSEVVSSVLPVTTSGQQVNVQPAASLPSASVLSRGAAAEVTDIEWPPKRQDPAVAEDWKPEALSEDVASVRVSALVGETEGGAAQEFVDVHGLRILPAHREWLLYPVAFLLLGVVIGVVAMVTVPFRTAALTFLQPSTCTSPTCAQNAIYLSHLLSWDDMNPCDDFYMFVCRRWSNKVPTASDEESLSFDDDYAATLEERMYASLRNNSRPERLNVQALSVLLDKCVDTKRIEDDWLEPSMSVWKLAGKLLRRSGTTALLDVSVSTRPSTLNQDVVMVGLPEVISTAEGVDVNELIRFYTNAAFAAVNALRKGFVPPAYTMDIAKFASELERLYEMRDAGSYRVETLVSPSPLLDFLTEALAGLPIFSGAESEVLIVSPAFVKKAIHLVEKTEPHTVINFLCVRFMIQTSAFLPSSGLTEFYSTLVYGKLRTSVPRQNLCVRVVERTLSHLFLYGSFTELDLHTSVTKFSDVVIDIVKEFLRGIDASPYFNPASRAAIRTLVSKTRFKVLGPSWVKDNNAVERYVKNFPTFQSQRPLDAYLALYEYAFVNVMLRGPSQRWPLSAFSTRCRYEISARSVYVPALLFNVSLSFDNKNVNACLFDMLLAMTNISGSTNSEDDAPEQWLNRETRLRLRQAERCFEERDDDRQSMDELRDLLAAQIAHGHFRRSVQASGKVLPLRLPRGGGDEEPVLGEDQLFFVYLVMQSCHKQSSDQKISGPHSGLEWNVVLRTYANFSDAFQCPPGAAMNPGKQCIS